MIAWFRQVYNPWIVLVIWSLLMAPLAAIHAILWILEDPFPTGEARRYLLVFPSIGLLGYGLWRGTIHHPYFRADYRRWLEANPWHPARPLPFGPVHLVAQDLVVAGLFAAPAILANGSAAVHVLSLGLLAYLFGPILVLANTGPRPHFYALLALVLLTVAGATFHFAFALPPLLVAYGVALHGCAISFERFPWPEQFPTRQSITQLGWPYQQLDPRLPPPRIRNWECPVIGLLLGVASALVMRIVEVREHWYFQRSIPESEAIENGLAILWPLGFGILFSRIVWMSHVAPPINVWGRLATGRLLIPGYDRFLIAPLAAFAFAIGLPFVLLKLGCPAIVACPASIALATTVYLLAPPRYAEWQLTAPGRLGIGAVKLAAMSDAPKPANTAGGP
jgi:hypothetical protein